MGSFAKLKPSLKNLVDAVVPFPHCVGAAQGFRGWWSRESRQERVDGRWMREGMRSRSKRKSSAAGQELTDPMMMSNHNLFSIAETRQRYTQSNLQLPNYQGRNCSIAIRSPSTPSTAKSILLRRLRRASFTARYWMTDRVC